MTLSLTPVPPPPVDAGGGLPVAPRTQSPPPGAVTSKNVFLGLRVKRGLHWTYRQQVKKRGCCHVNGARSIRRMSFLLLAARLCFGWASAVGAGGGTKRGLCACCRTGKASIASRSRRRRRRSRLEVWVSSIAVHACVAVVEVYVVFCESPFLGTKPLERWRGRSPGNGVRSCLVTRAFRSFLLL